MTTRRLLLSIHDVTPATVGQVETLHAHLCEHAQAPSLALLVVPHHWNSTPIAQDAGFKTWLRARHAAGDEIILHGWSHRDEIEARGWLARFKGRAMTAREGEFLSLDGIDALRRLREGRALLEDIIGSAVPGFIAPAWLYGDGAHAALAQARFAFAEDHFRVWVPPTGKVLARGPVITWASRTPARMRSSLAVAAAARSLLTRAPTVRIGVHPDDTTQPRIMDSIRRTARRFRHSHRPTPYAALAAVGASARL
ncbi:DUF2334 domain-containing protein [Sphingomonas sp.]|uniref:DUF2334 domain-containing protein n=1 Tax=Sphingomonas sp. TaxID=28214 RepID=UPI003B3B7EC2